MLLQHRPRARTSTLGSHAPVWYHAAMERCLASIVAVALAACSADDGHPPVARIVLAPDAILENDGFQTEVTLDATTSADPIDDPDGATPLTYTWVILDDEVRFERGRPTSAMPVVRFRGDRPATIELTATDGDGQTTTATAHLRLTIR
jgi:hypothetical protein